MRPLAALRFLLGFVADEGQSLALLAIGLLSLHVAADMWSSGVSASDRLHGTSVVTWEERPGWLAAKVVAALCVAGGCALAGLLSVRASRRDARRGLLLLAGLGLLGAAALHAWASGWAWELYTPGQKVGLAAASAAGMLALLLAPPGAPIAPGEPGRR